MSYTQNLAVSSTHETAVINAARLAVPFASVPPAFYVAPANGPARRVQAPRGLRVPGVARDIRVNFAAERAEWEEAYRMVAHNYKSRGYEPADARGLRFTAFHALPDTATFVARHEGRVVATLSLVQDNTLLGLPMESIYGEEIRRLRQEGRRLAEVTSLADNGLGVREFLKVFVTLIKLTWQFHVSQGGDTGVIIVNPRHRNFYTKVLGFVPLGPCRPCPSVRDSAAEAFLLDLPTMKANAPETYEEIFGAALPDEALVAPGLPPHLARYFGDNSTQTEPREVRDILDFVGRFGSPRRW
jgi:hypothetical protein